jgi:tetratricopeptide (TPR) repeat protein
MRIRSILGWIVFCLLIAVIAQLLSPARAIYYLFQGKQLFHARNYEAALESYKKSVEANPGFARGYVELGSAYSALNKYPDAEDSYKNAIAIQDDSCARCGLGRIYRVTNRTAEAEAELQKSIELNSKDYCPYDELGRLYYDSKQYAKALDVFEQRNKLKHDAVTYHFLANCNYKLGKIEESLRFYKQAADLSPDYDDVFIDQARAYQDIGQVAESTKALERAIELNPDNIQAHAYLGVTLFLQNDREGAIKEYQWLLKKDPPVAAQLKRSLEELKEDVKDLGRKKLGASD